MAGNQRLRGALYLVAVALLAGGATWAVANLLRAGAGDSEASKEKLKVVVAAVNIQPGWTIAEGMLQERSLPVNYIPEEAIRAMDEVVGRVAQERILFGEFVRDDRLAPPEAGVGLAAIIPRGMRAYQVSVAGGAAMAGFLNPGNFVDVIAVCTEAEPPAKRTILRSISVLGVNDRLVDLSALGEPETEAGLFSSSKGKPATGGMEPEQLGLGGGKSSRKSKPSVTLALTPEDTVLLKHASAECGLHLVLRNDIDVTNIESNDDAQAAPASEVAGPEAPVAPASPGVPIEGPLMPIAGSEGTAPAVPPAVVPSPAAPPSSPAAPPSPGVQAAPTALPRAETPTQPAAPGAPTDGKAPAEPAPAGKR
jgi:pilus assembly protein CpaB